MAKVRGPLHSIDAWKQFGKTLIFRRGGIVTKYFNPRDPKTPAQLAVRQAFLENYVAGLTQEQANLLYAAILHLHEGVYAPFSHVHDHGALSGLGDDDHTHYFNQTRGDARYSQLGHDHSGLVTGGDDHDHSGGDGGAIAYPSLSGKPTFDVSANDIFRCNNPGGVSAFAGTIATLPGGATLTYNVTSGQEGAMVAFSTAQLAKIRLHNTTRGTHALISTCTVGTNTITLTDNVPAGWTVGDVISIASQVVAGEGYNWIDLEIVSEITGKVNMWMAIFARCAVAGSSVHIHPWETYSASKLKSFYSQAANITNFAVWPVPVIDNLIAFHWNGTWTNAGDFVGIRLQGVVE